MTENTAIYSALASTIVAMGFYIRLLHKQAITREIENSKERTELTKSVTEAMVLTKTAIDGLAKVNDKIFDSIMKVTKK